MPELRWNATTEEWTIIAPDRIKRPIVTTESDKCPFCVGGIEIQCDFQVAFFENRYPSLLRNPLKTTETKDDLFRVSEAKGICEVIVYCPEHHSSLAQQSIQHICKLIDVWKDRYKVLGAHDFVKYVFIFENRGEAVGVTITHPHGQIYAFPYIPPKIQRELDSGKKFYDKTQKCLFCEILQKELDDGRRIVAENNTFVAFVPFSAKYPYEIHIYPRKHLLSLNDFDKNHQEDLAKMLKKILTKYDNLYSVPFPYMMVMHQKPTDEGDYSYCHFHIEYYPLYRSKGKLKRSAGCEIGSGSFINDTCPEEKAQELREVAPQED